MYCWIFYLERFRGFAEKIYIDMKKILKKKGKNFMTPAKIVFKYILELITMLKHGENIYLPLQDILEYFSKVSFFYYL